jgi:hypothetical protein
MARTKLCSGWAPTSSRPLMKKVEMPGTLTRMPPSTSLLSRGCRHIRGVPTKKGAPRPLRLPRDSLRTPAHTGIGVAPGIAFCYAYGDHKGLPCGLGAGDSSPAKALSLALFFCLCGVNAGGLGGSTVSLRPKASKQRVQSAACLSRDSYSYVRSIYFPAAFVNHFPTAFVNISLQPLPVLSGETFLHKYRVERGMIDTLKVFVTL